MTHQKFKNIWDALEDTAHEAANMRARSELMIALKKKIEAMDTTQAKAAKELGITQPRLNDLLRGKINLFSLDALFDLAYSAGIDVQIRLKDAA
jgi:predicted XRE-type DNA-binding protein